MKIVLRPLLVMFLLPIAALAQGDSQWPPLSYLRSDYRSSVIVAHVRVSEAEIVNRIGGYEDWRVACEIIEPFKGKFRRGDKVEYYHGAESGLHKEWFYGEKIIFLIRNFYEKEKKWVYAVLENSTLPYAKDRAQKLRIIRRSVQRKRRPLRRAQHNNSFNPSADRQPVINLKSSVRPVDSSVGFRKLWGDTLFSRRSIA